MRRSVKGARFGGAPTHSSVDGSDATPTIPDGTNPDNPGGSLNLGFPHNNNQRGGRGAALAAKDAFVEFLDDRLRARNWPRDASWTDSEPLHYPDEGYWERSIYKYLELSGEDISDLDIYLEIDYDAEYDEFGDFLGVAVYGKDFRSFNARDDNLLFLVANCAWVSGFVLEDYSEASAQPRSRAR